MAQLKNKIQAPVPEFGLSEKPVEHKRRKIRQRGNRQRCKELNQIPGQAA
jgi:hypothetical protein